MQNTCIGIVVVLGRTVFRRLGMLYWMTALVLVVGCIAEVQATPIQGQETVVGEGTEIGTECDPEDLDCLLEALIAEAEAAEEGSTDCPSEELACVIAELEAELEAALEQLNALLAHATCACAVSLEVVAQQDFAVGTREALTETDAMLCADDDNDKVIKIAEGIKDSLKKVLRPGIKKAGVKLSELGKQIQTLKDSRDKGELQTKFHAATYALLSAAAFRGDALEDISDGLEALKQAKTEKECNAALLTILAGIETAKKAQEELAKCEALNKEMETKLKELNK